MHRNRLGWGAAVWLLTLQFFVVEAVAELRFDGSYSRADDVISDLGTGASAAHQAMNASFVVQAALILGGALLLRPALRTAAGRAAGVLLGLAAVGVLLVGVFPSDGNATMHAAGAVLHLLGSGLGLIALAYAVRRRSEIAGTLLAALGLVGTAATVFFLTGVTQYLGSGGTERAAAYVVPIGLAVAGTTLWRRPAATGSAAAPPDRRLLREQERADRARRERERDEALEAAARRDGDRRPAAAPPHDEDRGPGDAHDPADDLDPEDPWSSAARRGL